MKKLMTFAVSALCAEVVSAATYYVSPDGSGEAFTRDKPGALQDAFDKVTATYAAYAKGGGPKSFDAGDVVILKKGLYDFSTSEGVKPTFGAGNSYGYVSANWLTIRADDDCEKPADVTILGGGEKKSVRALSLNGRIRVAGICFTNCAAVGGLGGAVYCNNAVAGKQTSVLMPSFTNCEFRCCTAAQGGAIYWNNTALNEATVGCVFEGNSSTSYGGAIRINSQSILLRSCSFAGNSGKGVVWAGSDTGSRGGGSVYNCGFTNNVCTGAVVGNGGSTLTVTNCTFCGNSCGTCVSSSPVVRHCDFRFNKGTNTGGACVSYASSASDCGFYCNTNAMPTGTYDAYGTIFISQSGIVSNCWFTGNRVTGGRYKVGTAGGGCSFYNCGFTNNATGTYGGAICGNNKNASYKAVRCSFIGNNGGSQAGIAWNGGRLVDCVCVSNTAQNNASGGFAAATNCLFFANYSSLKTGTGCSFARLVNCTVAGDRSPRGFLGASATAYNTLFYSNSGGDIGDGTATTGKSAWVTNCVLTGGYYTGMVNNMSLNGAENIKATLAFLRENCGCVTTTSRLLFNNLDNPDTGFRPFRKSSTTDAGMNVGLDEKSGDLAGNPRIRGKAIDIGCYECQELPPGLTILLR